MPLLILLVIAAVVISASNKTVTPYVPPLYIPPPRRRSWWERFLDFFTPPLRLNLDTLSPLETLVIAKYTGGTMRRRSGRRLTLTDYRRAMEEAAHDERILCALTNKLRDKLSRDEAHRPLDGFSRRGDRP